MRSLVLHAVPPRGCSGAIWLVLHAVGTNFCSVFGAGLGVVQTQVDSEAVVRRHVRLRELMFRGRIQSHGQRILRPSAWGVCGGRISGGRPHGSAVAGGSDIRTAQKEPHSQAVNAAGTEQLCALTGSKWREGWGVAAGIFYSL